MSNNNNAILQIYFNRVSSFHFSCIEWLWVEITILHDQPTIFEAIKVEFFLLFLFSSLFLHFQLSLTRVHSSSPYPNSHLELGDMKQRERDVFSRCNFGDIIVEDECCRCQTKWNFMFIFSLFSSLSHSSFFRTCWRCRRGLILMQKYSLSHFDIQNNLHNYREQLY